MNETIIQYLQYLDKMCGFSGRTVKFHKRICILWIKFLDEKDKGLGDVDPADFLCYIETRTKKVKNVSLAGELCVLRTLYEFFYNYGLLEKNPAAAIPELICTPPAEKSWLTVEECFQFLNSLDTSKRIGLRNYVLVALLWSTGLRISELCDLNWRDMDLEESFLLVRKGKGGKQRQVFFNERLRKLFIRYRQQMGGELNEAVFHALSQNGERKGNHARLSQSAISEMINKTGKKAGLKKLVSPLTFRHCFATHMYETGVKIADIKEMLGHDDETETTIYVHVSVAMVKRFLHEHIANSTNGEEL